MAKGFRPMFLEKVDPAKEPVEFRLTPRPAVDGPRRIFRGRIVGPEDGPVVGARVEVQGMTDGKSRTWGTIREADPLAVTDEEGRFTIHTRRPLDALHVRVEARGLSSQNSELSFSGDKVNELRLRRGASVKGRLMQDGKPVPGVLIGLVQINRIAGGDFVGEYTIGTDADGKFLIPNVFPGDRYVVYGKMEHLKERGAVRAREVVVGADGTQTDVGDLTVEPGHRLSGRVVLADGAAVPAGTRLAVSLDEAWDTQMVELDPAGRFEVRGVPPGVVSLSVRVKGYRVSKRNVSRRPYGGSLEGTVDGDLSDLILLYEPGAEDFNSGAREDWTKFREQRLKTIHGVDAEDVKELLESR